MLAVTVTAIGHRVIANYNLEVDYEGSVHKNNLVTQEEKEEDPNEEYAIIKIPYAGNFCERMMPSDV